MRRNASASIRAAALAIRCGGRLWEGGPALVAPHGAVIVEVGDDQSGVVRDLMTKDDAFKLTRTVRDSVTQRERVLVLARGQ